ncbi:hypothetical protein CDAR_304961 [Caerostris darwini]|uniref:Uncharacterized protein n=1 Tax=Caerostris darwini TaxID=1538125 RepID=A0AAV4N9B8_9ARAC|nr:hypothetical protein CDAR_304961 [Caerostris darwini]
MFSLMLGNYHSAGGSERCNRSLLLKGVRSALEGEMIMFGFECSEQNIAKCASRKHHKYSSPRLVLHQQEKYRGIKNPPSNCDFPYTKLLVCTSLPMRETNSRRRNQFWGNLSQVLTPFKFGQQTMTIKNAAPRNGRPLNCGTQDLTSNIVAMSCLKNHLMERISFSARIS